MKTIETKPGVTIGFIETKGVEIEIGGKEPKFISKLSEITEEQAKELVESTQWHFPEEHKVWWNYMEEGKERNQVSKQKRQEWNKGFNNAVTSLQSAALSLGIPESEFNNYLVVKL